MSWKFVDSISASPTTLLDLHNGAPFYVAEWAAPPPAVRGSSGVSSDGSIEPSTSFEDRTLQVLLDMQSVDADAVAVAFQALAKMLLAPRWLRYLPPTATKPVFFRTRACTPAEIEEFRLIAVRNKQVRIDLPAEPFGYGLAVTDEVVVNNDPTNATNGMRFTIADVKGDVPAPLRLDLSVTSGWLAIPKAFMIQAGTYGQLHNAAAAWVPPPAAPTDVTTVNDSSAIGGTKSVLAAGSSPAYGNVDLTFADVTPGDYRVLLRFTSPAGARRACLMQRVGSYELNPTGLQPITYQSGQFSWVDLGVVRLPFSTRRATEWDAPAASSATIRAVFERSTTDALTIDHAVLVPVPGGDRSVGRFLQASTPTDAELSAVVDGRSEQVWSHISDGRDMLWSLSGGGFPQVVPGVPNQIVLAYAPAVYNPRTMPTTVAWSYNPRYLYLRGD